MAEPVYLVDLAGQVYAVPPEAAQGALASGDALATPEQISAFQAAEAELAKFGDRPLAAGAAGAGRALTLGLSDVALTRTGLVEPETLRGLEEYNPEATTVGTVAGIAAPILLTGGAAAPAAGLKGALQAGARLTAPSLVARAGQAVTRGVAEALPAAEGTLGRIVQRAIATGAGSAIEGAAYGAGQVVSEAALGDPNLTAQSALATIGLSAALGGGLGATLGIAHEAIPALVNKARDSVGNAVSKLKNAYPEIAERLTGVEASTVRELQEKYALAFKDPKQAIRLQTELGDSLETMANDMAKAQKALYTTAKPAETEYLLGGPHTIDIPGGGSAVEAIPKERAVIGAQRALDALGSAVNKIRSQPDLYEQGFAAKLEEIRDGIVRRLAGGAPEAAIPSWEAFTKERMGAYMKRLGGHGPAMEALSADYRALKGEAERAFLARPLGGTPAQIFDELRQARQQVDSFGKWGKRALSMLPFKEREAVAIIRDVRSAIRDTITDEAVWGTAAARQAALDAAHHDYTEALKRLSGGGLGPLKSNILPEVQVRGRTEYRINPRTLKTFLNQMADPRGEMVREALADYLDAAGRFAREMDASFQHVPAPSFDRGALTDLLGKTGKLVEQAEQQASVTQLLNELSPDAQFAAGGAKALLPGGGSAGTAEGLGLLAASPLIGAMVPGAGPVAAVYGAGKATYHAFQAFKNVPKMVATLANLERMTQRVNAAIDTGASALVRGSARAAAVGRAEVAAGISREFASSSEEAVKRFNRRVVEIQRLSQDPEALHQTLVAQTEGLDEHAPQTSQAIAISSARAVAFLASKLPQQPQRGPLAPKWEPSQSEVAKFARYYEAVNDPLVVLKQAAAGTLSPEAVEAVQAVYPELLAKIRASVTEKMAGHRSGSVPSRNRIMLSMILSADVDGRISMLARAPVAGAPRERNAAPQAIRPSSKGLGRITLAQRSMTGLDASADRRR